MIPWRPTELLHLRTHYGRVPVVRIAAQLGRTEQAVRGKAHTLGLRRKPPWTRAQNAFLRAHYGTMTTEQLGDRLGHTGQAVKQQARRLRLGRPCKAWSAADVAYLEAHYGQMTAAELGAQLGFTDRQVWTKASALGLRKRDPLSVEAEWVLWELRDTPGVAEYFAREFGVSLPAVRRALSRLRARGGPGASPGNLAFTRASEHPSA